MKNKVIGYTEVATHLHRDNGRKVCIKSKTSVNKPLHADTGHADTQKVSHIRVKVMEEEVPELNGDKFYQKDLVSIQESVMNAEPKNESKKVYANDYLNDSDDEDEEQPTKTKGLTALQVLKNFVDNIAMDIRQMRDHNVLLIVGIICSLVLSAVAFTIMVMK